MILILGLRLDLRSWGMVIRVRGGGSKSVKLVMVPPLYLPVTPFGEYSIWRNSGQVGVHSLLYRRTPQC